MGWLEDLRPATYDGNEFQVERWGHRIGRQAAINKFPQRDTPAIQDTGRQPREYPISGFVIGDDFLVTKARIDRSVEDRPPGYPFVAGKVLEHPFLGTLKVHCLRLSWTYTSNEGGFARFDATFIEVGEDPVLPESPEPVEDVGESAAIASAAAGANLERGLKTTGIESLRTATANATSAIGKTLLSLDVFSGPASDVLSIGASATNLINSASQLATSPASLAQTVLDSIDNVANAAGTARGALFAYEALAERLNPPAPTGASSNALAADSNAQLVTDLALQAAAIGAAQSAANIDWATYEEAIEARARIAALLTSLLEKATAELAQSFRKMRSTLLRAVPPSGENLPRLASVELAGSTPSIVLAYQLYDDADRGAEIAARNRVRHPAFLPAGEPLEVLTI